MANFITDPTPNSEPPKGNLWFVLGGAMLGFANNIFIQKHGNAVPDVVEYCIYPIAIILILIGIVRYEKFHQAGGNIKEHLKNHPVSVGIICLLLLMILCNVGVSYFGKRGAMVQVASNTLPISPPATLPPVASPPVTAPINVQVPQVTKPPKNLSRRTVPVPASSDPVPNTQPLPTPANPQPTSGNGVTVTADHGIAVGPGAYVPNPVVQDNRQYGIPKPLPFIVGLNTRILPAIQRPKPPVFSPDTPIAEQQQKMNQYRMQLQSSNGEEGPTWNPGLILSFRVNTAFVNAMFEVHCDRPCAASQITLFMNGGSLSEGGIANPTVFATDNPRVVLFGSGSRKVLTPDVGVGLTVRSLDGNPIGSATVEAYAP